MRFASLGSGSRGNSLLVEVDGARLLIDAGFGPREMLHRLARLGCTTEDIDAVLVTHEHTDHVGGAFACARRYGWKVYMTSGTFSAVRNGGGGVAPELIDSHTRLDVFGLEVLPFPVPHDAREPVQFSISDGKRRLVVVTDAGHVTAHMVEMVSGCDALVLECNHDRRLLADGTYPAALKWRIGGPLGHLDNEAAASLLSRMDRSRLRHVIAAHLSEENNAPALARRALSSALNCTPEWIGVADQGSGFDWRTV